MTLEWPQVLNCQKHTLYTLNTHPEAQISRRFALRLAIFEIQGCWKLEMHGMITELPYALNCQKSPVYTEYWPPRSKFHPVSLYDQPFSRYKVFESRKCTE